MKKHSCLLIFFMLFILTACSKTEISLPSEDNLKQIDIYENYKLEKSVTSPENIAYFLSQININSFNSLSKNKFEDLLFKNLSNRHVVVSLIEGEGISGYLFIWENGNILFQDFVNKSYCQSQNTDFAMARWLKEIDGDVDIPPGEITTLTLKLPPKYVSKLIRIETDIIPISDADQEVVNWIKSLNQQQGVFWARRGLPNQQEQYFMYGNNIEVFLRVVFSTYDGKGIDLQFDSHDNYNNGDLYIFTTQNHKAQYLIVNEHKINISEIPILNK